MNCQEIESVFIDHFREVKGAHCTLECMLMGRAWRESTLQCSSLLFRSSIVPRFIRYSAPGLQFPQARQPFFESSFRSKRSILPFPVSEVQIGPRKRPRLPEYVNHSQCHSVLRGYFCYALGGVCSRVVRKG